jgi:transposase
VDALGNPLKIMLTAGQVHDLAGADTLVPGMEAEALLADKAYDADKRVIEPLEAAGKTAVIPPKKEPKEPPNVRQSVVCGSSFDRELLLLGKAVPRHRDALR